MPAAASGYAATSAPRAKRRSFPGWRWMAVGLAFPVAGLIGWKVGGRVDAVDAALLGGALTGAGLGAVQWWAAKGALGRPAASRDGRGSAAGWPHHEDPASP